MEISNVSSTLSKFSNFKAEDILSAGQKLKQVNNADNLQASENASGEKGGLGAMSAVEDVQKSVNEEGKGNIIDLLG